MDTVTTSINPFGTLWQITGTRIPSTQRKFRPKQQSCVLGEHADSNTPIFESICGGKKPLIEAEIAWGGEQERTTCIQAALLQFNYQDPPPLHVHGITTETYHIIAGHGRMVLDDKIYNVGPGSHVLIAPGTQHGLLPHNGIVAELVFFPPMVPITDPLAEQWRDEEIISDDLKAHIQKMKY